MGSGLIPVGADVVVVVPAAGANVAVDGAKVAKSTEMKVAFSPSVRSELAVGTNTNFVKPESASGRERAAGVGAAVGWPICRTSRRPGATGDAVFAHAAAVTPVTPSGSN